jgi:uncharacterized protein YjbI with pentapeptide repeats
MARCKGVFRRGLRRLRWGLSSLDPRRDGEVRHQAVVREAHKQYAETINKLMLSLLSVSFFCLLTIFGSPDRVLLKEDSTIKIPFTDTVMPFVGFSIVAPFLLIVLTVYLHIFFGYGLDCERERQSINQRLVGTNEPPIEGIPTLFSLPNLFSSMLTGLVLYGLVPLVLGSLTWKAAARSDMALPQFPNVPLLPLLMYVTVFVTCYLMLLVLWRCLAYPRLWQTPVHCVILLLIIGLMVVVAYTRDSWFPRRLNLEHAELPRTSLHGKDLRDAYAKSANLQETVLDQAYLERADLSGTNLEDARLWNARLASARLPRANLVKARLPGADLRDADLTGANLTGADLTGAILTGATLTGATLTGTNLGGADLRGAHLPLNLRDAHLIDADLTGATLTRADLTGADLKRAKLQGADLRDADLTDADLRDADLRGASLMGASLTGADLRRAKLRGAYLVGADLKRAKLQGADLRDAYLTDVDLPSVDLRDADLRDAYLTGAKLQGADLRGASLTGAYLTGADLPSADLRDADLRGAYLAGANLQDANLQDTDLRGAYLAGLAGADLAGTTLTGAYLTGANLETVTGLTQDQVDKACWDDTTTLPTTTKWTKRVEPCPPASSPPPQ